MSLALGKGELGLGASRRGQQRQQQRREVSEEERQEMAEAFSLFDTDKDGALDYHELKV